MLCVICGTAFTSSWKSAKFCSAACRAEGKRAAKRRNERGRLKRRRAEHRAIVEAAGCAACGGPLAAATAARRYCSDQCRYGDRDRRPEVIARQTARRRELRQNGLAPQPGWNSAKAKAALYGVEAEDIDRAEILELDGWKCGICGDAIDSTLAWPHPKSASIDHIVPWSRGGAHTRANVQAACLDCNINKSDSEQLAEVR